MSNVFRVAIILDRNELTVSAQRSDIPATVASKRVAHSVDLINDLSEAFRRLVVMRSFASGTDRAVIARDLLQKGSSASGRVIL
jgi:hypothetical protein